MRILVTGATGLIGSRLVPILLKAGHAVVATSREPESIARMPGVLPFAWDGREMLQVPGRVDAIIHLAGEPIIAKRWSEAQKQRLRDSRIQSTKRIVEFIERRRASERPKALVCANAVGFYGIRPEGQVTEESPAGTDFLAQLCKQWEEGARAAQTRVVILRIGHVLSRDGGYLGKLLPLARFGLAGPMGGGRQPMPWVHIDDVCGAILWAIGSSQAQGAYNVTGPEPKTQKQFVKALNKVLPIPSLLPVPGIAIRIRFGEAAAPILGGQDAPPGRLVDDGYEFGHTQLSSALQSILRPTAVRRAQGKTAGLAKAAQESGAPSGADAAANEE